jgi:hypothetical protein
MRSAWKKWGTFGNIVISIFVLAQILDGIFTYVGVTRGLSSEANPLGSWLMSVAGVGLGVMVLKFVSVGMGIWLYSFNAHTVLALATVATFVFAVFPWAYIFWMFRTLSG